MSMKRIDIAASAALFIYASSMVITPICLLAMAREFGFNYSGGGALGGMKSILILAALLFSGLLASKITKRISVAAGLIIIGMSLIGSGLAQRYTTVLLYMVFMGIGSGLIEALTNPLVHDAHPNESNKYLNYVNAFYSIGVVFTVLIIGLLLTRQIPWRSLFIASGICALLSALLFLPKDDSIIESGESIHWSRWLECIRQGNFWILAGAIFFGGGAEAAFTFWTASYIQVNFSTMADAAGVGTGLFALAMALGRIFTGRMTAGHAKDRWLLLGASVLGLLTSLLVYRTPSLIMLYIMLFLSGLSVAPYWPTIQSVSTSYVRGDSTLLFILLSCFGIPGIGAVTWFMGYLGDLYGLRQALVVIPASYAVLIGLFALLIVRTQKR